MLGTRARAVLAAGAGLRTFRRSLGATATAVVALAVLAAAPAYALRNVQVLVFNQDSKTVAVHAGTISEEWFHEPFVTVRFRSIYDLRPDGEHVVTGRVGSNEADLFIWIPGCGNLMFRNPKYGYPYVETGNFASGSSRFTPVAPDYTFSEWERTRIQRNGSEYVIHRLHDDDHFKRFAVDLKVCAEAHHRSDLEAPFGRPDR